MAPKGRLDNLDIVPFAFLCLGATGKFVDVEDAFLKCFELAPERFRWRKHNIPNYKTLSKALRDFEERHPGFLLKTEDGLSRQLSAEALLWIKVNEPLFAMVINKPGSNPPTRRADQRVLNELKNHALFKKFAAGEKPLLRKAEVADVLLCAPDSPPSIWRERLESYRSMATDSGRLDILSFLDHLTNQKPEWFGRE